MELISLNDAREEVRIILAEAMEELEKQNAKTRCGAEPLNSKQFDSGTFRLLSARILCAGWNGRRKYCEADPFSCFQQHAAPAVQLECFFLAHQLACHQRKQIRRFLERVFPLGIVAAFGQVSLFDQVAVGQQHRISFLVAAQHHGVFRHHVRAIGEPGDLAETFGLALGKEIAVGNIQPHHRSILLGLNQRLDLQRDLVRCVGDAQFPV